MKIKSDLASEILNISSIARASNEKDGPRIAMPCRYFGAVRDGYTKAVNVSCANCRAERMVAFDSALSEVDCYTLMIIDFLKSCGVEVEDA